MGKAQGADRWVGLNSVQHKANTCWLRLESEDRLTTGGLCSVACGVGYLSNILLC